MRPTPAMARLEWADGVNRPTAACWGCLKTLLRLHALPGPLRTEEPCAVTVTPIDGDRLSPCGTRAAYVRHRKHGEEPCDPCKLANTADSQARAAGDCPHCGRPFRDLAKHLRSRHASRSMYTFLRRADIEREAANRAAWLDGIRHRLRLVTAEHGAPDPEWPAPPAGTSWRDWDITLAGAVDWSPGEPG